MITTLVGAGVLAVIVAWVLIRHGDEESIQAQCERKKPYHTCPKCGHKFWSKHSDEHLD